MGVITYNGETFNTIEEVADRYGLYHSTLRERLNQGKTLDEAMAVKKGVYEAEVFGEWFGSMIDISNHFGVSYAYMRHQLRKGKDIEEIIEQDRENKKSVVHFRRKTYQDIGELCKEYKKDVQLVKSRVSNGWELENALFKEVTQRSRGTLIDYRVKTYTGVRELSNEYGLSAGLVSRTKKELDVETGEALDILLEFLDSYDKWKPDYLGKIPYAIYNGKVYETATELFKDIGLISMHTVSRYRKSSGVDNLFDALDELNRKKKSIYIDTEDNKEKTRGELVKKYGEGLTRLVKRGKVRVREVKRYQGMSFKREGYCVTPREDFYNLLRQISQLKERKTGILGEQ